MMIKRIFLSLMTAIMLLTAYNATANLLIYPVRVSFDEKERTSQLTLTNTSQTTNTYRLGWREKKALPTGGYENISPEEASHFSIASPMLRFAPRQVTLEPGQRQIVKVSLRRPRGLPSGEYRSHLLFKSLPKVQDSTTKGTSMSLNMTVSFAVPVSVQQGPYDSTITMTAATIKYDATKNTGQVSVILNRKGLHSASGDIEAYWTPDGGEETLIAKISDYNLWAELENATANLIWTDANFTPTNGKLRIEYKGVRDFSGITYVDESSPVKQSDIEQLTL